MITGRTRSALLTRLARLESRAAVVTHPLKVRFGKLRLPRDYKGEKHVVVAKQLPKHGDQEWAEFEELPGPDPHPQERGRGVPEYFNVVFVAAYAGA
jgi:hypothetical protein